jgi:hypothetical protein
MRRAIALALMLIFSSLLMAPLFATDPDANLPACCRRHGKHHCIMSEQQDGRPGLAAVRAKCPFFPASTCTARSTQCQPVAAQRFQPGALGATMVAPGAQAGFRVSTPRSHPKRGPPYPLA